MMRVTISIPRRGGRQHGLAVNPVHNEQGGWVVQPWHATLHGRRFDSPVAGPFKTCREAEKARRELLTGGRDG